MLVLLACAIVPTPRSQPSVVITYPQSGSSIPVGHELVVQSVSATTDARGIARVELWVDGQVVRVQTLNPPVSSYGASLPWTPNVLGTHVLEVRAYTVDNIASAPAQVYVNVLAEAAATSPSTSVVSTPGSEVSAVPAATGAPSTTAEVVDEVLGEPIVTALVGVNVRSGPGVEYAPPIGWLARGQSARITGRDAAGTWWQIEYPPETVQRGWVSAKPQYTTASNAQDVPVVPAPPTPTPTPTPTDTPTPTLTPIPTATSTATPNPLRPVIFAFMADRYVISPGEVVTLRWDFMNAEAAYLRYAGGEEEVTAPGTKVVSPATTTTYVLVARNAFGTTTAEVTIVVRAPSGARVIFDFLSAAPGATWSNGRDLLPWSGSLDDPRGFARWRDSGELEDGSQPARVLEMHPERVPNGNIVGLFTLPAPVQTGDRFLARVGFLARIRGEARFLVGIDGGSLSGFTLLAMLEDNAADGALETVEADLSAVAGGQRIWLVVQAGASAEEDHAVWVNPRIERQG